MSHESVEAVFASHGCKLLDTYQKAAIPMRYICKCGHDGYTCWSEFRRGNRCGWCGKRQKLLSEEEVKKELAKFGCELLSPYQKMQGPLHFKCCCDREYTSTLLVFRRGGRCDQCNLLKISGSNNCRWNPDRERIAANKKYRMASTNLVHRCLQVLGKRKHQRSKELLGYTPAELKAHITTHADYQKLTDKKWHIDHIFPITAFVGQGITDLKLINCLDNLRPMLGSDNIRKHDKYEKVAFAAWLKAHGVK